MPLQKIKKQKPFSIYKFFYLFLKIFHFIKCKVRKIKYAVEKDKRKMMDDEKREKNKKCKWWKNGRKNKYGITIGLPPDESFMFIVHEHDFPHDPS
jgi:hypothetical protein